MTIYDLKNQLERGLSLIYAASFGTLQHGVRKLLGRDMIAFRREVHRGRRKKIYTLTQQGREAFQGWMTGTLERNGKWETYMLVKVFFLGHMGKKERLIILDDLLSAARERQEALLVMEETVENLEIPDRFQLAARYQLDTLEYGLLAHQAGVLWLEKLIERERG